MFLDHNGVPISDGDDRFRRDAEALSKFVLAGVRRVQESRPPQFFDGKVTVHCLIAGIAFSIGVIIKDLPRRERKKLREYLVHKLDQMLAEHGASG